MPHPAARMQLVKSSAIRELLALGTDPDFISFGGGYPDPATFPVEDLDRAFHESISANSAVALQYAPTEGTHRLRAQIAERMRRHEGIACEPENVLIIQGAQQALDLAGKMWLDPGDIVITENPTFLGGLVGLNPFEPEYRAVRTDEQGMDPDHLEAVLRENPGAKLIYTVPDFHNPTGYTLARERRRRVVELAREYDVIILEDTPYRELYFTDGRMPTLKSFDTDDRVYFIGSFSKTLAPGLRTGWLVSDPETVERLALLKLASDTQNSTLNMSAISCYLDDADYDAHLSRIRHHYLAKRDFTLAALRAELPGEIGFNRPDGGLFIWLTFPETVDTDRLLREHLIPESNVGFVPGSSFYAQEPERNRGRLGFPTLSPDRISEGVQRLAAGYAQARHLF